MGQDIMKFSVIIPSLLADYRGAAKNREMKILRAINSVFEQTYKDFEIIVVADGCQKTIDILKDFDVKTILVPKNRLFSGVPRMTGITNAIGEYIIYLDIDDLYGENHLKEIDAQINGYDWVWFNDIRYTPKTNKWYENPCEITKIGRHGTSNICHRRTLPVKWDHDGYAHDYYFVQQLRNHRNYSKIENAEYYVCHLPGAGGYDL